MQLIIKSFIFVMFYDFYQGVELNLRNIINEKSNQDNYFIQLLRSGEEEAFSIVYDNYAAMLYGVILRIVKNEEDAQNLVQDAFIKIWQHVAHYDPDKGRLATWLINIARNTAIDFTRSKYYSQKQKIQNLDFFVSNETGSSASAFPVDIIGIKNVLDQLTPACRQVIEWMYFEGYTQQEIADDFNIPLGTVKSRARLALMELRTFFE